MKRNPHLMKVAFLVSGSTVGLTSLVLLLGSAWVQGGQTGQGLNVSAYDPRPLAKTLELVEQRYGWIVTYEDPPYEHQTEVEDVTAIVRKDGDLSKKVLGPKGGPFDFRYEPPLGVQGPPDPKDLLGTLLDTYSASGNPGLFGLDETFGVFHIIPVSVRKADGQIVKQSSMLQTTISLPEADRSVGETLQAILGTVTRVTGKRLVMGTTPIDLLFHSRTQQSATSEAAKTALVRALTATGRKLSWQLFYDPGQKMYALNVHLVN